MSKKRLIPKCDEYRKQSKESIHIDEHNRLLRMIQEHKEKNEWEEVYKLRRLLDKHSQLELNIKKEKKKVIQLELDLVS